MSEMEKEIVKREKMRRLLSRVIHCLTYAPSCRVKPLIFALKWIAHPFTAYYRKNVLYCFALNI